MRPVDKNFIKLMEVKLQHGRKCGYVGWDQHWKDCLFEISNIKGPTGLLINRLQEEVTELVVALASGSHKQIALEAADVANFAMFIADIVGGLDEEYDD